MDLSPGPLPQENDRGEFMTRYLLGELPEPEAARFEDQYSADETLFEDLTAMEAELIDAYVHGELTPERRNRFETKYLASARQRQKVEDGMLLARKTAAIGSRGLAARARALVASAAIGALVMAGALYTARRIVVSRTEVSSAPDAPTVYSFMLSSSLERGAGSEQDLAIPPGTVTVRLRVDVDSRRFSSLDAVIENANGEEVWSRSNVSRTQSGFAEVDVPARLLRRQLYILTLTGQTPDASTIAGEYSFRVE